MNPLVLAALVAIAPAQSDDASDEVIVMTDAYDSQGCASYDNASSSIPYAEIEVRDGAGNLLGVGRLDGGTDDGNICRFVTEPFALTESDDGFYEVTIGTGVNDTVIFDKPDWVPGPTSGNGNSPYGFWVTMIDMDHDGVPDDEPRATPVEEEPVEEEPLDAEYSEALNVWGSLPSDEDLCPEYRDDEVTDALIDGVYPGIDHAAVRDMLEDYCTQGEEAPLDAEYSEAYDAWLDLPTDEDLCPEYSDDEVTDSLINRVYPGIDHAAVRELLADYC